MITHHASEATLLDYATGTLPEALALVLATHLTSCRTCRDTLATLEAIGGALLEAEPPADLTTGAAPDALERLLARQPSPVAADPPLLQPTLPAPLNRVHIGRWWPLGIGVRWRPLQVAGPAWGGLILVQPRRALPRHSHQGRELTCVLAGAFTDGEDTFVPGDLCEPQADHDAPLVAISDEPCLCVVATEGMRLRGVLGLAQRLIGF